MIYRVKIVKWEFAEGETPQEAKIAAIENMNETIPCVELKNVETIIPVNKTWAELEQKRKVKK